MAKSLLDNIIDSIFDDQWVGRRGEKLTVRELNLVKLLGRKGMTLKNVYIPKGNGETSEIDVLFITQKGIFVFESKNYSGWIFGDEKDMYWMASLPNKQKNRFYNPIKQNKTHIKWLQKYIGDNIPLFSIIVFSERCELKSITLQSHDVKVIKRDHIYATVRKIWEDSEDAVTDVDALYNKLKPLTNVDKAVKLSHIADIERKFKNEKNPTPIVEDEKSSTAEKRNEIEENTNKKLICPRCGRELVLRTAKKGQNAGNKFYGCSGFPSCRFVKEL